MRSLIDWKRSPNAAGFLAMQVGCTPYWESDPGQGKSTMMSQVAEILKRELYLFIGSIHAPEDFGGIPFPSMAGSDGLPAYFDMVPAKWAIRFASPGAMCFFDELPTVKPSVRAPILSVLTERKIGNQRLHQDTIFCAAGNPIHQCPDASPLEKSFANRLIHFKWKMDFESFAEGLATEDDQFPAPQVPIVSADWRRLKVKYGAMIGAYLRRNPADRTNVPNNDEETSYPTYRSWTYLRNLMCAAEVTGAPADVEASLAEATVGKTAGPNFLQFKTAYDLVDPEAVLLEKEQFKFDRKRIDLAAAMMVSLVSCVKANYTPERMEVALKVVTVDIGSHAKDLVLSQLRHLINAKPASATLTQKSMDLIKEFGKHLPKGGK